MDLADFVEASLTQIIEGVRRAQKTTRLPGKHPSEADVVNPRIMYGADSAPKGKYFATQGRNLVHFVEFDVAVTTEASDTTSAGVKISVLGFGVGGQNAILGKDTVASRIRFDVPVTLPQSESDA